MKCWILKVLLVRLPFPVALDLSAPHMAAWWQSLVRLMCENRTTVNVVLKCSVICFSTGGASNVGQGGNLAISGGVSTAGTSGAIVMFTPDAVHEMEVGLIISQCCLFVTSG